jgi:hypothetical protein
MRQLGEKEATTRAVRKKSFRFRHLKEAKVRRNSFTPFFTQVDLRDVE